MPENASRPPGPPRIGLFGGAFDPPHYAHMALARAAVRQLGLSRLHVTPTGRLAFAHEPRCVVDGRETRRDGPSYTIDTLAALQAEYPGAALYLQIGADQAAAFHTWKDAARILEMAALSIAIRAGQDGQGHAPFDPLCPLPGLPPALQAAARIHVLRLPAMPHSSTQARQLAAQGLPLQGCVPPSVARYIARHHLYTHPASS